MLIKTYMEVEATIGYMLDQISTVFYMVKMEMIICKVVLAMISYQEDQVTIFCMVGVELMN